MKLHVVILAAGKGTRMKSELPKVLHPLAGKPLLQHVIDTTQGLNPEKIHVVYGHQGEKLKTSVLTPNLNWVEQAEQLGTGHAVGQVLEHIPNGANVLILYGDVPLIQGDSLHGFLSAANAGFGLMTVLLQDSTGYGRILRDKQGNITAIVEQKDASTEQLDIKEINTGIMALPVDYLKKWLPKLKNTNAQKEYYLTDIVAMANNEGLKITPYSPAQTWEVDGVNDRVQLARLERIYQRQVAELLMRNGVSLADPSRLDVRGILKTGTDCFIDINVVFEGECEIGSGVSIAANCIIRNSRIGDNVEIESNSLIDEAVLEAECHVGPFARLRPGAYLSRNSRVGNFVEIKKSHLGEGSKVNHLSYVGDATVGKDVNIGAGTITCNYDGVNKFQTTIGDRVFVGSNTALVAPVMLADDVTVGAGSTITKNVDTNQLAIARGQQRNIAGWKRPKKLSKT
ncbi:MAG: bifunctional UDP-N-acetylglucosamine diphosphorylase/glucosamine-1-phosphate N-acetyltransferase GlmU [Hahellaceae bacterium]|nr:bifunctional UDP-N-acetylglucosamine diphosphorylase/glucosamine-1-phosphate N-acetyltransferase GlmU [Hahellaceae bacterium]